jgi:hypothetical protein
VIVEPPFPITEPAAEFDTRNLTYVGFSTESERSKHKHYVKNDHKELIKYCYIFRDQSITGVVGKRYDLNFIFLHK